MSAVLLVTLHNISRCVSVCAYQGADIADGLEYLHLAAGLAGPADQGLLGVHGEHVGAPERRQVVLGHQVLVALGRHHMQVPHLAHRAHGHQSH